MALWLCDSVAGLVGGREASRIVVVSVVVVVVVVVVTLVKTTKHAQIDDNGSKATKMTKCGTSQKMNMITTMMLKIDDEHERHDNDYGNEHDHL